MTDKFSIIAPTVTVTPDGQNQFSIINPMQKDVVDPNADIDFSANKMMENLLPSLKQEAIDIGSAILSPMETGESLLNLIWGGVQKLDPTGNWRDDGVGLTGDDKIKYANAIGEYYANKYGSLNAFKRELQNNPASVLGDASMFITGGATAAAKGVGLVNKLAKTETLGKVADVAGDVAKVGASIDPFNIALNTSLTGAGQGIRLLGAGEDVASNLYESALKPSMTLPQNQRKAIVKTALDNKLGINSSGIDKLQSRVADLNARVDKLIDTATDADGGIPSDVIFKNLQDLKKDVGGFRIDAADDLKEIAIIEQKFQKWIKKIGKDKTVTAKDLQEFKIDISSKINWKSKNLRGTPTEEKLFENLRKSAKEGIADAIPEISPLNKELSELLNLEPYLIRGADRIGNRDFMGIGPGIKSSGGRAIAGDAGAAAGVLSGIFDMPRVKSGLGIAFNEYRNNPISALLDNKATRPLITNLLGTVGDANYDNSLLPFKEIKNLYGN
tara:strand:- start:60 stop:1562 length:1503 start_codon:yes stop_codon:yes gene_type:complete